MNYPLDEAKIITASIVHEEFNRPASFNPDRFTEVYKTKVMNDVESKLGDCKTCPLCKVKVDSNKDVATLSETIKATAFCVSTYSKRSPCLMTMPKSDVLGFEPSRAESPIISSEVNKSHDVSDEQDLEEAVQFEMSDPKYSNFGSW